VNFLLLKALISFLRAQSIAPNQFSTALGVKVSAYEFFLRGETNIQNIARSFLPS
jgi:hypothetical protein